jgi:hypothetical protein
LAFLVAGRFSTGSGIGLLEIVLAVATLAVGVVAVLLAETATAYIWLAILVVGVVLTWAVQIVHHSGMLGSGPVPTH